MTSAQENIEGRLDILLAPARGIVEIRSSRPVAAARVFEGRSITDTLQLLPLLYNVCGQAQAVAAVRAVESALQTPAGSDVERARDRLVDLETLREHLWRVLLDWPRFYGSAPSTQHLAPLMGTLQATRELMDPGSALCRQPGLRQVTAGNPVVAENWRKLRRDIAEQVFGADIDAWLAQDPAALDSWVKRVDTPATQLLRFVRRRDWGRIGDSDVAALPALADDELLRHLDGDAAETFVATPELAYRPAETGTLVRRADHPLLVAVQQDYGRGLYTRLLARLVEIGQLLSGRETGDVNTGVSDWEPGSEPVSGSGLAQVEAARGRLCHRVVLDGQRVARYQILAPTEWNFGPRGPAVEALRSITRGEGPVVQAQADLLIHAIDPCVGYRLEMEAA